MEVVNSGRIDLNPDTERTSPSGETPAGETGPATIDVAVAAEEIRAKCGSLQGEIVLGIGSDQVLLRVIDLPPVEDAELADMAELQVDKFSPFPVETMVVSHEILQRNDDGVRVLIAAVREEVVNYLGDLLAAAGIKPTRVDAAVMGWWHLLHHSGAVAALGRHAALLVDDPAPQLIVADDSVPIAFQSLGSMEIAEGTDLAHEIGGEISYALMSLELERGGAGARTVSAWTTDASPPGLAAALAEEASCEVDEKPLDSLGSASEGLARRAADVTSLVDLTPAAWRQAEAVRSFKRRIITATAVVLGVWLACMIALWGGTAYQRSRLAALEALQQQWAEPALEVRDLRRRVVTIERYMDRTYSVLECLREVSRLQPEGVDLTQFSYKKADGVDIAGEAAGVGLVYDFKNALDASNLFGETTLLGPRTDTRKRKEVFEISIPLPGGEE